MSPRPLRVGNASAFYGDRFSAVREMLEGGPLDVLTGDYLAELTMLILGRRSDEGPAGRLREDVPSPDEGCLALAIEKGVRIVTNAGGLRPAALAEALRALAASSGSKRASPMWRATTSLRVRVSSVWAHRSPPTRISAHGGSRSACEPGPMSS